MGPGLLCRKLSVMHEMINLRISPGGDILFLLSNVVVTSFGFHFSWPFCKTRNLGKGRNQLSCIKQLK